MIAVCIEEARENRQVPVAGEPEVPDASVLFLLHQITENAVLLIVEIGIDVHFTHIVEEIEVKIGNPQLLKLPLEDLLRLSPVGRVIPRELGRDMEALPRIAGQSLAQNQLRVLIVVAPGGVVIVDTVLHGRVHHAERSLLIDPAVISIKHRKAHRAEAERRQFDILKISVNHWFPPLISL